MLSLRATSTSGRCLSITPTTPLRHRVLTTCRPLLRHQVSETEKRGIHDISLPVCSEETVYTRSAHAFSRAQAQAQMEIAELRQDLEDSRRAVAEKDAVAKEKDMSIRTRDATIRDQKLNLAQQRDIIQQLEKVAQGVGQKDGMIAQGIKSRDEIMGDGVLEAGRMMEDRVERADMMMELMREMRESRREAYDPL